MTEPWKLSPSDLTFLWDECPRCFYLKVVKGFNRPWGAFPKIFSRIDQLMKVFFEGKPSQELARELPNGSVQFGERWVTSLPIHSIGGESACFIRGKFDSVVTFSDGSYAVVDFKTTEPRSEHVDFYSRQLHAYAYALENPAPGSFHLAPVNRLGLLCVEPVLMDRSADGKISYMGDVTWLEIPKDVDGFLGFLQDVIRVLEMQEPPPPSPNCGYCQYRQAARSTGY